MDATSFDVSPTTLGNLNDPTPSTPSIEPWNFGRENEFANRFLFEHHGFWLQTGHETFDNFLQPTSTWPSSTTLHFNIPLQALYSPNSPQSWTAFAITKKQQPDGPMAKHQYAHAPHYDNTHPNLNSTTNISFWMAIHYTSPTYPLHRLPRAPCRTRFSHRPRKYISLSDRLSPLGLPGIPSHHYHVHILMIFGPDLCNLTEPQSRIISLTRTSFASNNSSQMQSSTMKINVLHPFEFTARRSTTSASPRPSPIHWSFANCTPALLKSSRPPSPTSTSNLANYTLGHLELDAISQMHVLPKRKKQFLSGRPIVSFFTAPFRPMLNCIAKMIYHLLPQAFPHNLAKGDVFDLIKLLKNTDFDNLPTPRIHNQDLASIDTERFIDSWRLTLKYLSSTMSTDPDEIISVKATTGNTTGDVVKGRTCRTLNVTRKIFICDIERIILMSLKMTQFSIGTSVYEQIRGSPMGSPLSPALCMMVVALSEEIWYQTYHTTLATMDLSARLLRYVDNRLCLADPSWDYEISFTNFLHPEFYGNPIILETEPDQEFLGFCIEFEPFARALQPSTRLQPGHGTIFGITIGSATLGLCISIIFGRQMCAPCFWTDPRFCRFASIVHSCRLLRIRFAIRCQAYTTLPSRCHAMVKWLWLWLLGDVSVLFFLALPQNLLIHIWATQINFASFRCTSHFCSLFSLSAVPHSTSTSITPWLHRHLRPRFRSKNQFFNSLSMMFITHISFYIELWPYSLQLWYQILSRPHCRAPESGTNLKASNRNIRTPPIPFSTMYTSRHQTLKKKNTIWTTWRSTISLDLINIWLPPHRMLFLNLRRSRQRQLHRPRRRTSPNPPQKLPPSENALRPDHHRAHPALCPPGHRKKSRNYAHWNPMKSPDFRGEWSPTKWENLNKKFAPCGTRSRTAWDDWMPLTRCTFSSKKVRRGTCYG